MRPTPALTVTLFAIALQLFPGFLYSSALAIECYECHGNKAPPDYRPVDAPYRNISTGGFQGNHQTHMGQTATPSSCNRCHSGASAYGPGHRNAQIDISPNINSSPLTAVYRNGSTLFPQRTTPRLGSCSNVNCHFENETPVWGGTAYSVPNSCTQCHGSPPDGGDKGVAGSHAKHGSYYPGLGGCAACHSDHRSDARPFSHATSVGRNLLLAVQNPFSSANGAYSGALDDYLPKSQSNQFGSCSNVYCHSRGDSKTSFIPNSVPTWGTPLSADCTGCHGNGHGTAAEITSGSHTMHVGRDYYGQYVFACSICHSSTASGNSTIGNRDNHVNRKIDVVLNNTFGGSYSGNGHLPGSAFGQCANNYCHSDVQPDGGVGGPTTYATPTWGAVNSIGCGGCHATGGHGHGTTSRMATGSHQKHLSYSFTTTTDTVKCIICHKYTDYPFITSCFGNPYGNIICHASGTSAKHANGKINVRLDPVFGNMSAYQGSPEPGNGYSNCTNTYCHSNGTSIATGAIPPSITTNWGSGTVACNACHGNPPSYANGEPKANSHAKHASFSCSRCHYGTTTTGTTVTSVSLHVNKAFNVSGPPETPFTYSYAATGGTCTSNSCHSDGTSVSTGTNAYSSATWGSPSGCTACHGAPPDYISGTPKTNSHSRHSYMSCSKCHWATTQTDNTITGPTAHLNNQYDVSNSSGTLGYSYSATGGSCSGAFGCHQTATWGGSVQANFSDCLSCHKSAMGGVRQVADSNGDGTGAGGDFKKASHHVLNYKTVTVPGTPSFNPSATSAGSPAGFVSPENAYASDAIYASSSVNGDNQYYQNYNIGLPGISQVITKVEVGAQGYYTAAAVTTSRLYIKVSWDNGVTWSSEQYVTLPRNSATTTYLNFFTSTTWDASKLNNEKFKVQVRNVPGTGATNYLDWLPVRVSYSSYNVSHSITNADCLVCHEVSQHPGGKVRLKDADTGAIYLYDPVNPAGVESFCLSCHDTNGANGNMVPFSDAKSLGVAPYKAGVGIKASWNKSFGHRQKGLTCLGNGSPNTGCHANGHGGDNVGMLSQNLTMPLLTDNWYSAADEQSYQACFGCHQSYPNVTKEAILGYRLGGNFDIRGDGPPPYNIPNIMTKFRDINTSTLGKVYDDPSYYFGERFNLHYFHVQGGAYKYRDIYSSSITCISCHNVHGSNTQWGAVYDEMQFSHFNGSGGDVYGRIVAPMSTLSTFPTSCTYNCHNIMGTTSSWFEPANE